jgi:RimJ/RimL family protein N-acetyltransferase
VCPARHRLGIVILSADRTAIEVEGPAFTFLKPSSSPMRDTLQTERLLLRRWRDSDRLPFQQMNADPRVMEFFPAGLSPAESDALVDRAQAHFDRHGFGPFAVELLQNQSFIGFIGLSTPNFDAPFMPAVEIGWRLAFDRWGRGLATEGARAVIRYAFEDFGLDNLVSFTVPENLRSRRVMEKLGMIHDPRDDFDHPRLPEGHSMRRHVLYRLDHRLLESWESWDGDSTNSLGF